MEAPGLLFLALYEKVPSLEGADVVTDNKIDCTAQDLKGCQGGHDCLGTEGVLRVSLGCFIFYFTMFLTIVGSTKLHESRDSWHSGWWPLKSLMWITMMVIPFLVPSTFIQFCGEVARFGTGIFLIIQLVSVINFITWWNDYWVLEKKVERCFIQSNPSDYNVNNGLCFFLDWNHTDVHLVCSESIMCTQHIFHHMDSNPSSSND